MFVTLIEIHVRARVPMYSSEVEQVSTHTIYSGGEKCVCVFGKVSEDDKV